MERGSHFSCPLQHSSRSRVKYLPAQARYRIGPSGNVCRGSEGQTRDGILKGRRGEAAEALTARANGAPAGLLGPGPVQTGLGLCINVAQGDCWSPWRRKANSSHVHQRRGKTAHGQVSPSGLFILTQTRRKRGTTKKSQIIIVTEGKSSSSEPASMGGVRPGANNREEVQ